MQLDFQGQNLLLAMIRFFNIRSQWLAGDKNIGTPSLKFIFITLPMISPSK